MMKWQGGGEVLILRPHCALMAVRKIALVMEQPVQAPSHWMVWPFGKFEGLYHSSVQCHMSWFQFIPDLALSESV